MSALDAPRRFRRAARDRIPVLAAVLLSTLAAAPICADPGDLEVGARVQCDFKGLGKYYPGVIAGKEGDRVFVRYDDGDEEHTTIGQCRLEADPAGLDVGARVQCDFKGLGKYYPGVIASKEGDRVFIRYDDGDEEHTTIGQCRLEERSKGDVTATIVDELADSQERLRRLRAFLKDGTVDANMVCTAIKSQDLPQLTFMLESDPDAIRKTTREQKLTPLECAVIHDWVEGTELLLVRGADPNTRSPLGATVLHEATGRGWDDVAAVLLDHGVDINARTPDNFTALHIAAMENNSRMAQLLLTRGADTSIKARQGFTALQYARQQGYTDVVFYLEQFARLGQERFAAADRLMRAAWRGDVAEIERIIGHDKSLLGVTDELGRTPLHAAAQGKQPAAVSALLRLGADPQAKTPSGRTPLEVTDDPETFAALRQAGAFDADDVATFLSVAAGGDVEHLASIVQRLPKLVNAQDRFHGTALMFATSNGHLEAVKFLLDHGASPKLKNDMGKTPYDEAKRMKFDEIAKLLKQHGG